jgi:GH25 family lysozyme M1 (1,4-beta-N-acetylmuramidase)
MILGTSVSHWADVINWKAEKAKGVDFAWVKATQGNYTVDDKLDYNCKGAQDAGMVVGLYHYQDPNVDQLAQAKYFVDHVRPYNPDMISMDFERYWVDNLHPDTTVIAPKELSTRGMTCRDKIKSLYPEKLCFDYSGAWFVSGYTRYTEIINCIAVKKSALDWMKDDPLWWVDWGGYRKFMGLLTYHTIEEALQKMPTDFHLDPTYPSTFNATWKFWQFSADKYIVPEDRSSFEFNVFNGTLEDLKKLINLPVNPSPILTLDQRVTIIEREAKLHGWNLNLV